MALRSFVYIGNVDNLSDARYAAGMGVDLIGFKLDPEDETSLPQEKFKEIAEWISGVKIVGEFGTATPEEINSLIKDYAVDYILISNESQIHDYAMLGLPLILKVETLNNHELDSTLNYCSGVADYFLFESEKNDINLTEMELIKKLAIEYPILLGYGVTQQNANSIVDELRLKGIALKGSPELRPGYKDFDNMADILEELEVN